MKVIAFAGQMRNGKDQVAAFLKDGLRDRYDETWSKSGWAEGLKSVVCESFGLTRDELEKHKTESDPPPGFIKNVRQALQLVGDDFRQIKEDVWISWTMSRIKDRTMIIDTRYPNELAKVREVNGINVLVVRPGMTNDCDHPSE